MLSEKNERILRQMRDSGISFSERVSNLETELHEKDQTLTQQAVNGGMINNGLEQERPSLRQLQKKNEQEREANSRMLRVWSDLEQVNRALDKETFLRNRPERKLREKETNLADEQQARLRLEDELREARETCAELERRLENERLLRETTRQDVQTKEDTIREQSQLLQQERELKSGLEERVGDLQIQIEVERNRRIATERELQSAATAVEEDFAEYRRLEPRDWIIGRDEVILSETSLGVGAWGNVHEGTFRGFQVAVKQIHDLILSPHNRRLFEREMSIASRCRHPHLLQFIGATNDDGSPLFITELLDTDLRNVLTQRALHHEEVVCIALDVAKGLNYLHLNKPFPIIHRDISSSNVLLWRRDDCWRAKLSDYGAANFMRQYMTSNPGASIYAAPETQTSQQSPKVDVYSFGVLLCEMCTGELPVPQQIQDQISLVANDVLRELIMLCVARAPEARPTMSDVISVLTQQAESLPAEGLGQVA
ncbi:unnamed protein product [Porites evermanni]|uniref:Protein kinase domain-containing protein n=1 Tax=Porites evermanni TaxID=104178 RepID=A0ABN8RI44_9CNID|nr:unnamed protein product [Porites evermanni]